MAAKEQRAEYETPETKLLKKRRGFYKQKEDFEIEKKNFKEHEAINKNKEDKIREQDALIQENLIKFCKHLHDNESDRLKAKQRVQDETKNIEAKIAEMESLKRELDQEKRNRDRIDEKLRHLKKYDDYLSRVIKMHQNEFSTKEELIQRHDRLEISNRKLEKTKEEVEQGLEQAKKDYVDTEKKTTNALLTTNNALADLKKQLDQAEQERAMLQDIVEGSKKNTSQEAKLVARIFMTIQNLKNRCVECNQDIQRARKNQSSGGVQMMAKKKEAQAAAGVAVPPGTKDQPAGKTAPVRGGDGKSGKLSPGRTNPAPGNVLIDPKTKTTLTAKPTGAPDSPVKSQEEQQVAEKPVKEKPEEDKMFNGKLVLSVVESGLKSLLEVFANMKEYRLYKNSNAGTQGKSNRK